MYKCLDISKPVQPLVAQGVSMAAAEAQETVSVIVGGLETLVKHVCTQTLRPTRKIICFMK